MTTFYRRSNSIIDYGFVKFWIGSYSGLLAGINVATKFI